MESSETHWRVDHLGECQKLLETLTEPGGAALIYEAPGSEPLPALLMEQVPGQSLILDITAVPEIAGDLESGLSIRLVGQARGSMLRTPPLQFLHWLDVPGRLQCHCAYPDYLEVVHRRAVFRAELRTGMDVAVTLASHDNAGTVHEGALCNLSLGGCLITLPASSAATLSSDRERTDLTLAFPNGQQLTLPVDIRHVQPDRQPHMARVGCQFVHLDSERERRLWFYVREIERESARRSAQDPGSLAPSPLFATVERGELASRPHGAHYATPMARRLAHISGFLSGQLLELQSGRELDPHGLSKHADQVLTLLEGDREALLFACICQIDEPTLVQHGVTVAVRLADMAHAAGMDRNIRKAIVASAMVHDFGKVLLPGDVRQSLSEASTLSDEVYHEMTSHVALLQEHLAICRWLDAQVSAAVVGAINERLDGSGYPHGRSAGDLDDLARMAAVVDVIDAMGRPRPDRCPFGISDIYRHLLHHPERFDTRWIKRYIHRFGVTPIGSLGRFASGQLAWIQRLDDKGRPSQVQLAETAQPVMAGLGDVMRDDQITALGELKGLEVPEGTMSTSGVA
ncbi:HD domain-containing phosphohydrolase [Aidingimonas halophila]|uniref:PilZ domain-containing protein n=1 Tax=Aidingimonas halophila TaxID=574349 RepID=A0A1H2RIP8_9GAMM|nr:HD domain-containing phosphohydrolase [Aidingimonas halophila]GHC19180.1 hypothetical protein GCM10008094_06410 [Aidingimonas halophila]SDW19108.1 PilZ domain-containing protein [Aidingimonas halophila]